MKINNWNFNLIWVGFLILACNMAKNDRDNTTLVNLNPRMGTDSLTKQNYILPKVNIEDSQIITSPLEIIIESNDFWQAHGGNFGTVSLVDANDYDKPYASSEMLELIDSTSRIKKFKAVLNFDTSAFEYGHLYFEHWPFNMRDFKYMVIPVQTNVKRGK